MAINIKHLGFGLLRGRGILRLDLYGLFGLCVALLVVGKV